MKTLLNKYLAESNDPTSLSSQIDDIFFHAAKKILEDNPDHNPLELEAAMIGSVVVACSEYRILYGIRLRDKERKEANGHSD